MILSIIDGIILWNKAHLKTELYNTKYNLLKAQRFKFVDNS